MTCSTDWPCVALKGADLAGRTTMHVGGTAEWLLEPATPDEFERAWRMALERGLPMRVLGGGANIVIADGELPGATFATDRMRRIFRPMAGEPEDALGELAPNPHIAPANPAEDPRLVAWAGCTLPALLRAARDLGYSGLEGLVGVPGHVGGGVAMNAGGRWGDMWDVVERVRVLELDGAVSELTRESCQPSYRDGGLKGRVVIGAVLRFDPQPKLRVAERMREYLLAKNAVQPVTEWTAGCIFKNPDPEFSEGRSAGKLIDDCGGKQLARGDALVSPLHGNFIVNRGQASAVDVCTLMEDVRDLVAQKTGVQLEFEVKRWGV
jgi:UDP-N-acetylmuramate dehydrogenase